MDWTEMMQGAPLQDQAGQIDQQLADLLMRRKLYQPAQHSTGLGALLGGIGDYRAQQAFRDQEGALRTQRAQLGQQMAAGRSGFLQELMQAQQPQQAPPSMIAAPGVNQASVDRDQQQRLARVQAGGMLSGDPQIQGYLQQAPKMALEGEQVNQSRLMQAMERQKMEQAGPQAALGGQTPSVFEMLTKREQVPKVASDVYGRYQTRGPDAGKTISGTGGMESLISPEAIDQSAGIYLKTGQLPSFGRANPVIHGAILKRAAELSGGADIATSRAGFHADSGSLAKAQSQADSIESFENTALKNLDNFRQVAKSVIDVGSPLFNAPLRTVVNKIGGSAKQAQFNAARQVAVQEIGKVLGGAVQGGAITDSQRHEVESLLSGDMSLAQIDAVSETLKQDMANRKAAVNAQLGTIRGRMGGGQQAQPAAAPATDPAALRKKYGL